MRRRIVNLPRRARISRTRVFIVGQKSCNGRPDGCLFGHLVRVESKVGGRIVDVEYLDVIVFLSVHVRTAVIRSTNTHLKRVSRRVDAVRCALVSRYNLDPQVCSRNLKDVETLRMFDGVSMRLPRLIVRGAEEADDRIDRTVFIDR